jgi:hypothetical protein
MPLFEGAALAAMLAAIGIILIVGIVTYAVIKEKLRGKDFFKATIKNQSKTLGVPVVTINIEDNYGNSVDELKLASIDGANVTTGTNIYKSEL